MYNKAMGINRKREFRPKVNVTDKVIETSKIPIVIRQLLTGYSKLNEYRHKLDLDKVTLLFMWPQSVAHYLEECENYTDIRERCRV